MRFKYKSNLFREKELGEGEEWKLAYMLSNKFYKMSLFTNVFVGYAAEKDNGNGNE